jgi:hypothetical protein
MVEPHARLGATERLPLRPQRHSWLARKVGLPRSSTASSGTRARRSASKACQSRPLIAATTGRARSRRPARGPRRRCAGGDGGGRTRVLRNRIGASLPPVLPRIRPPSRRRNRSARPQAIAAERGDPFRQVAVITLEKGWTPRAEMAGSTRRRELVTGSGWTPPRHEWGERFHPAAALWRGGWTPMVRAS